MLQSFYFSSDCVFCDTDYSKMFGAESSVEGAIRKEEPEQTEHNALLGTECDLLVENKINTSLYSIIEVLLSIKLSAVSLKYSSPPKIVLYFSVMRVPNYQNQTFFIFIISSQLFSFVEGWEDPLSY